jgi:serine/threonine protein kinase
LPLFFFCSDGFCSLGDATSIDLSQISGSSIHTHLSQDVSAKEKYSSIFLNVKSDNDSESYSCSQQIPRYNPDRSDSFIVFETSCGQESKVTVDDDSGNDCSHEDGLDLVKSNIEAGEGVLACTNSETSSKCLSAWSEEIGRKRTFSATECHEAKKKIGHKRPLSLDICNGGEIVMASLKASRMYLFIQMQLCRRESLREWLRDNVSNRSTCVVLPMFMKIVQAVEYVHLQGLIHRDLKVRIV